MYYVFDVLVLSGKDVMHEPLMRRRELLQENILPKLTERYGCRRSLMRPCLILSVLHILVVGINAYRDSALHLGFAQQDASDLAAVFEQHADRLPFQPRVIRVLGECATKEEILSGLDRMAGTAQAGDAVMVFLAGHGREEKGDFWFYSQRFRRTDTLPGEALAASDVARRLAAIPARRQLLILDACQSGSAADRIRALFGRGVRPGTQFQILTASAASEDAMEVEQLGHGLLSSALLENLREQFAAGKAETAGQWLRSAVGRVPAIVAGYNKSGTQTPVFAAVGANFGLIAAPQPVTAGGVKPAPRALPPPPPEFSGALSCRPTASDKTFIRPEGLTELMGDIVFRCSGQAQQPKLSLQVFYNTAFSGRPDSQGGWTWLCSWSVPASGPTWRKRAVLRDTRCR